MKFSGLQKTSLIDFPGEISSVLFTPGCNLRCPFCQNWRIVMDQKGPFLSEDDALTILESRKKFIDAVVITGGEPLIYEDAPFFLRKLKERGFLVKLDTNGFFPERLKKSLDYVDYVAVDVKTSLEKYPMLGAKETEMENLLETIRMLKGSKVDYEFRNTVVPIIVEEEDIAKIGELVKGAKRFAFQQFIPENALDERFREIKPYEPKIIEHFSEIMKKYVKEVILRI
ncbi:MAG: anaerobic ribonucleoside-triphosphate reductase activating protein [Candidatus Bathyarchaeia archaeon]|nr:anaerobic ribonucleoside-triphosphate reductase activating protein [Candidatus Bathyarchaeota archaeon]